MRRYLRCAQAIGLALCMLIPQAGATTSLPAPISSLVDDDPCRDDIYSGMSAPLGHRSKVARGLPNLSVEIGRRIEFLDRSQQSYLLRAEALLPSVTLHELHRRQPPIRWQLNLQWRFGEPPLSIEVLGHGELRERIHKVGRLCRRIEALHSPVRERVLTEKIARQVEIERLTALILIELVTLRERQGGISWLP